MANAGHWPDGVIEYHHQLGEYLVGLFNHYIDPSKLLYQSVAGLYSTPFRTYSGYPSCCCSHCYWISYHPVWHVVSLSVALVKWLGCSTRLAISTRCDGAEYYSRRDLKRTAFFIANGVGRISTTRPWANITGAA